MTRPTEIHQPVDADNSTLKVLQEARKLIEKPENWCQGRFHDGCGRRCSAGAMTDAIISSTGDEDEQRSLYEGAKSAFEKATGTFVMAFNDSEGRTHAEVLAAFDRAIEAEQAKATGAEGRQP